MLLAQVSEWSLLAQDPRLLILAAGIIVFGLPLAIFSALIRFVGPVELRRREERRVPFAILGLAVCPWFALFLGALLQIGPEILRPHLWPVMVALFSLLVVAPLWAFAAWLAVRIFRLRKSEYLAHLAKDLGMRFEALPVEVGVEGFPPAKYQRLDDFLRTLLRTRKRAQFIWSILGVSDLWYYRNLLQGPSELGKVTTFDYLAQTQHHRSRDYWKTTVFAVELPGATLPPFQIYSRSLTGRVFRSLLGNTADAIDVSSRPEFSRRFSIQAAPSDDLNALLNGPLADFLESHPGLSMEVAGCTLICHHLRYSESGWAQQLRSGLETVQTLARIVANPPALTHHGEPVMEPQRDPA